MPEKEEKKTGTASASTTSTKKKSTKKTAKKSTKKTKKLVGTGEATTAAVKRHDSDTGSPEVQIVNLTRDIEFLQQHVQTHNKDFDAKTSLLKKVAKRRTFLKYLKGNNFDRYVLLSKKLGLKV